ncbi:Ras association domain-containing protein 1 [Clonorchis sinensis]|uniref:Ras association domain-containing protein 1 n=1 Tax=Clonorchis sinensis TaxID=79923 RepID=A0A419PQ11_CLOSI|nr:Ras association domain-containing protein 1 [Clonorchis sinensis]
MIGFLFQDILDSINRYFREIFEDQPILGPFSNHRSVNLPLPPPKPERIIKPLATFSSNRLNGFDSECAPAMLNKGPTEIWERTLFNGDLQGRQSMTMLSFEKERVQSFDHNSTGGHHFCPIPLDSDTFCDVCSWPICNLGNDWEPICLRCADCHMTCHPRCLSNVQVTCHGNQQDKLRATGSRSKTFQGSAKSVHADIESGDLNNKLGRLSFDTSSTATIDGESPSGKSCFPDDKSNGFVRLSPFRELLPGQGPDSSLAGQSFQHNLSVPVMEEDVISNGTLNVPEVNQSPHHMQTMYYTAVSDPSRFPGRRTTSNPDFSKLSTGIDEAASPEILRDPLNSNALKPPPSNSRSTSRQPSEIGRYDKRRSANLKARHSFLAGQGSDATIYTRLFYDFSSLDREAIKAHGIRVRELTPETQQQQIIPSAPAPSPPAYRKNVSEPNKLVTSESSLSSRSSDVGYATVMQSTAAAIKTRIKRTKRTGFTPAPSIPLTPVTVGPRGRLPYTAAELNERLNVFNANEFGLQSRMVPSLPAGDCEGQVRIHINLLRPIHMLLTVRPVSIFDLVGKEDEDDTGDLDSDEFLAPLEPGLVNSSANGVSKRDSIPNGQVTDGVQFFPPKSAVTASAPPFSADYPVPSVQRRISKRLFGLHPQSSTFWLPRGSTKLLYVRLSTTTKEVITTLLHRFQIEDNPQKFALYEHTIEGEQEVTVRKLFDDESPLGLLLSWTESGPDKFNQTLGLKRLVLQENETGDIEWSGFTLSELQTFLRILNQEEADYRKRIELKYELRQKEVIRLLELYEGQNKAPQSDNTESSSTFNSATPTLVFRQRTNADENISGGTLKPVKGEKFGLENSLSAPVSPARRVRDQLPHDQSDVSHPAFHEDEPQGAVSTNITPYQSPERKPSTVASTLPRLPSTDDRMLGTLFKPSAYRQMKKAEKAHKKQLARIEKDRAKAEKKRLKAEAKLTQQKQKQQSEQHHPHHRWLFGLTGPSTSPSSQPEPSNTRSTLKH